MPFSRPTLTQLRARVAADIGSALPGADALLRYSNLTIIGRAQADLAHEHFGYLDWIAKQAVPYTATDEFLEAWAGLKGVTREPAAAATGQVTFTGTSGTDLPAGTEVVRGDGATFTTQADATVGGGGTVVVTVVADLAGAAGNSAFATVMTLGVAIAGIQSGGSVTAALTGGADPETDASLRSRMLEQYAAPPQGGDLTDYIEWALQVAGVTRAWILPNGNGAGTVIVYTMFDVSEAAHGGFPQGSNGGAATEPRISPATGDQLAVANHIYPLQPVTALVYSVAPIANAVNFTISLPGASAATKAAIAAAITGVFMRYGGPGGTYDGNRNLQGTVDLSYIEAAINAIPGTAGFVITSPTANIVSSTGQIPTLGTITWI